MSTDAFLDQLAEGIAEKVVARLGAAATAPAPAHQADDLPEAPNTKRAAAFLGLKEQTLKTMRVRGTGPAFYKQPGKYGGVRYIRDGPDGLRAFRAKRLRRNTSEVTN